jgi:hypothetical protein
MKSLTALVERIIIGAPLGIMPKARCCRDTVYEAILALEAMGVFSNDSGLMDIDRRNQQPVRLLDCCGIGGRIRFFFKWQSKRSYRRRS